MKKKKLPHKDPCSTLQDLPYLRLINLMPGKSSHLPHPPLTSINPYGTFPFQQIIFQPTQPWFYTGQWSKDYGTN